MHEGVLHDLVVRHRGTPGQGGVFPPIALYAGLGTSSGDLTARFGDALDADAVTDLRARGAAMDFDETIALARVTAPDEG